MGLLGWGESVVLFTCLLPLLLHVVVVVVFCPFFLMWLRFAHWGLVHLCNIVVIVCDWVNLMCGLRIGIAPALGQITLTLNLKYPILLSDFSPQDFRFFPVTWNEFFKIPIRTEELPWVLMGRLKQLMNLLKFYNSSCRRLLVWW